MNALNTRARLAFTAAALAFGVVAAPGLASAQSYGPVNDNILTAGSGEPLRNGDQTLCWRNGFWTPATADRRCDGAIAVQPMLPPPVVAQAPAPAYTEARYVMQADAFFDFDSSRLKPEGRRALQDLAGKIQNANVRHVVVLGFTDRIGSDAYNDRLSQRRADAARAALVEAGVDAGYIEAQGRGKAEPVVQCDNRGQRDLIACLAPNRRVEIVVRASRQVRVDQAPSDGQPDYAPQGGMQQTQPPHPTPMHPMMGQPMGQPMPPQMSEPAPMSPPPAMQPPANSSGY